MSGTVALATASSTQAAGTSLATNEYIVKLKPSLTAQNVRSLEVDGQRLERVSSISTLNLGLYRAIQPSKTTPQTTAQQLSALAGVESATPNTRGQLFRTPNDTYYPYKWDAQMLNLPNAWNITTGASVTVAVVDSGIVSHPDLNSKLLPGYDFVSNLDNAGDGNGVDNDPTDPGVNTSYHGTHVAGIIGASTNNGAGVSGVSWGARIVPVRVGGKLGIDKWDMMYATYWAAGGHLDGLPDNPNPAKVINLSLGGTGACSSVEQDLFNTLAQAGVVVVAAAGNENVSASTVAPANCDNVITVGAVGPDGKRAPYSNYGARVDVMAPGGNPQLRLTYGGTTVPGNVLSTVKNGYDFMPGTSMAAPQVSGVAALLLGNEPGLTPTQVRARLKLTATPLSDAACGVISGCGAGLVNAAAVLGVSGSAPAPQPVAQGRTWVIAFYRTGTTYDGARSRVAQVPQVTLRNPFQLTELEAGTYSVVAWQDLDDDSQVDDGEPVGVYPTNVVADGRALNGINIQLTPYRMGAASVNDQQGANALLVAFLRNWNRGQVGEE
ncbi:subtilisin-like serine protease (plasmid) [Deinococcus peraridilitoris DSM 19664]|uniref:Subtilisin-like serine protease n=2 Tax=Deinococcus TaxID=1298 RepID=L0A8P6_DEIPD|nr:subtilisin-like serine protease [Deinococcus peraridilitoris DSM 19664]